MKKRENQLDLHIKILPKQRNARVRDASGTGIGRMKAKVDKLLENRTVKQKKKNVKEKLEN